MKAFTQLISPKSLLLALGLLTALWQPSVAQSVDSNSQSVIHTDQTIVPAIAPYRDDVRRSILIVSENPDVLNQLAQQRESTQQAFTSLIQSFGQNKQDWY